MARKNQTKCKYCGNIENLKIFPNGRILNVCIDHLYLFNKELCDNKRNKKCCKYCGIKNNLCTTKSGILPVCKTHYQLYINDISNKRKKTMNLLYGYEYPAQVPEIRNKIKNTILTIYNVDNISKSDYIKNKKAETCLKNFGIDNPFKSIEIINKIKKTNLEKYNVEWQTQSNNFKEKSKQTNLERYGTTNPLELNEIKEKKKETCLKHFGVEHPLQDKNILNKVMNSRKDSFKIKIYKNTKLTYQTKPELNFIEYCMKNNIEIKNGNRIPYYFNAEKHYYFVDFKIKDKGTKRWRLIEIKAKHKWYYDDLKSGKLLAKVRAAQEFSKLNNYLSYKILFL